MSVATPAVVATALTVYGIETLTMIVTTSTKYNTLQQLLPFTVLKLSLNFY